VLVRFDHVASFIVNAHNAAREVLRNHRRQSQEAWLELGLNAAVQGCELSDQSEKSGSGRTLYSLFSPVLAVKNQIARAQALELVEKIESLLQMLKARLDALGPAQPDYKSSAHRRSLDARSRVTHDPNLGSL
jgi:hypothetical protein